VLVLSVLVGGTSRMYVRLSVGSSSEIKYITVLDLHKSTFDDILSTFVSLIEFYFGCNQIIFDRFTS
jgi:hypothetical protein